MNMQQKRLNGWRRLAVLPLMLLAILMLVLAGSLGTHTAHAQSTLSATFSITGSAKLIARTTLQISGTASCTLPDGATLPYGSPGGTVTVTQASGRVIVQAQGGYGLPTCDGTAYPFQMFATLPAGSAPFHGGRATATSNLFISWNDALGNFHEDDLLTGPLVIKISG